MKKTGILLLIVGVSLALEALIKGQGSISVESAIFSLTLVNLAYIVYTRDKKENKKMTYKEVQKAELDRIKVQSPKINTYNLDFEEDEIRDKEFITLINKFSNIRIESLIENTKDNYKRKELIRVLNKRKAV